MVEEFAGAEAENKFEQWARDHQEGFFINKRSSTDMCLHRVGCWHVFRKDGTLWPGKATQNPKICSLDRQELEKWAWQKGTELKDCSTCSPR